jgi:molybdate transport system permease protein
LLFIATFFSKNSPLGQLLNTLRITIVFSWYGAVIATTVVAFPLMYKTVLGSFEQVEPNIVHAARVVVHSNVKII